MQFCPKCKAILIPKLVNKKRVIACNCGYVDRKSEAGPLVEKVELKDDITVITDTTEVLPTAKARCPECNHGEAYFWLQQTRAGDEPETRFFKCVKCAHTWRDYS
jgi:DNA-directed RNA polymerase subunit M